MTNIISSSVAPKAPVQAAPSEHLPQPGGSEQTTGPIAPPIEASVPKTPPLKVQTAQEVFAAAERINELLRDNTTSRSLRLSMDESLNRAIFTVLDTETNEVIRVIPSDEVIAMARIIESWIPGANEVMPQGILFDDLT